MDWTGLDGTELDGLKGVDEDYGDDGDDEEEYEPGVGGW